MNNLIKEFSVIEKGQLDRTMSDEYLPQLHSRGCQVRKDLEAFSRVIKELEIDPRESEIKSRQVELLNRIQVITSNFFNLIF